MELTHISLFTGIGGIDLAAGWAGFRTVLFVEIDNYCQKVLKKRWPDVPTIGDIRDATKERIMAYAQSYRLRQSRTSSRDEIQQENRTAVTQISSGEQSRDGATDRDNPITLITGGFPCQPVSTAGKRRGKEDDRWLWPEMLRVISEVRPTWIVAENVAGLLRMGFNDCVSDLEGEGYETIPFLISACGVNAPHRRDRIFIVGYSEKLHQYAGNNQREEGEAQIPELGNTGSKADVADADTAGLQDWPEEHRGEQAQKREGIGSTGRCSFIPDTQGKGLEGADSERSTLAWGCPAEYIGSNWWATEPELGRVAHGIPNRVDRLKCLGNAVVPQLIYLILKAIADIENQINIRSIE